MVSDYQRYECETYISGKNQRSYKCMMIFTRYQGFSQRGGALESPLPTPRKLENLYSESIQPLSALSSQLSACRKKKRERAW